MFSLQNNKLVPYVQQIDLYEFQCPQIQSLDTQASILFNSNTNPRLENVSAVTEICANNFLQLVQSENLNPAKDKVNSLLCIESILKVYTKERFPIPTLEIHLSISVVVINYNAFIQNQSCSSLIGHQHMHGLIHFTEYKHLTS